MPSKPKTWLSKISKKGRDELNGIFAGPGFRYSTDGAALFVYFGDDIDGQPDPECWISQLRPGKQLGSARISEIHLRKATDAGRAFKPNSMSFSFNGQLDLQASNEDTGTMRTSLIPGDIWTLYKSRQDFPVVYEFKGNDTTIKLDPDYLRLILQGMEGTIEIRLYDKCVTFRAQDRMAILCYMN